MVNLPHEITWGDDWIIRLSQGNYCIRWDVLDAIDREPRAHGHEEDPELAMSEAFDWLASHADYYLGVA